MLFALVNAALQGRSLCAAVRSCDPHRLTQSLKKGTMRACRFYGPVAQLGERSVRIREVVGSNPFRSTIGRISEPYIVWGTVFVQTKRHSLS